MTPKSDSQRNDRLPASSFESIRPCPFLGQKMFKRRQKKRTKFTLLSIHGAQIVLAEKPREKLLGQVLGVFDHIALAANVGIKRIPIDLAQSRESPCGLRGRRLRRRQYHAPMRGRKLSGAACQWEVRVIRFRHGQLNALIQSDRE